MDYPMRLDSRGNFVIPTTPAGGSLLYINCSQQFSPLPPECTAVVNPPSPAHSVPEPASYISFMTGLCIIFFIMRWRSRS